MASSVPFRVSTPATLADLRAPKDLATVKGELYDLLITKSNAAGKPVNPYTWESGAVPATLIEVEAESGTDYQVAQKIVAESGLIDLAEKDALTEHAKQVYQFDRRLGQPTVGWETITDSALVGPVTFSQGSLSFSVGQGGLTFDGVNDGTTLTLPRGGSVRVKIQSRGTGSKYVVAAGSINFPSRGIIPGVTVTNESTWLTNGTTLPQGGTQSGCQQGTSDDPDTTLRTLAKAQWGTLGTGSPESAYRRWAMGADVAITKVAVLTNLDLLDPGRIDVIVAGSGGGVGAGVVTNAQNAIAPLQTGGERIPETARVLVTSATNYSITVSGTLYVQASLNTAAFQAQVAADLSAFQADLPIGALVSWERLLEVVTQRAGSVSGIITDVENFSPTTDTQLAYDRVAVFTNSLTFKSV